MKTKRKERTIRTEAERAMRQRKAAVAVVRKRREGRAAPIGPLPTREEAGVQRMRGAAEHLMAAQSMLLDACKDLSAIIVQQPYYARVLKIANEARAIARDMDADVAEGTVLPKLDHEPRFADETHGGHGGAS